MDTFTLICAFFSYVGRDLDAIRKARVDSKRRTAYEKAHFALVGRPAPTVIPFSRASYGKQSAPAAPSTRILRNLYISQVGKFQFRLIHRYVRSECGAEYPC